MNTGVFFFFVIFVVHSFCNPNKKAPSENNYLADITVNIKIDDGLKTADGIQNLVLEMMRKLLENRDQLNLCFLVESEENPKWSAAYNATRPIPMFAGDLSQRIDKGLKKFSTKNERANCPPRPNVPQYKIQFISIKKSNQAGWRDDFDTIIKNHLKSDFDVDVVVATNDYSDVRQPAKIRLGSRRRNATKWETIYDEQNHRKSFYNLTHDLVDAVCIQMDEILQDPSKRRPNDGNDDRGGDGQFMPVWGWILIGVFALLAVVVVVGLVVWIVRARKMRGNFTKQGKRDEKQPQKKIVPGAKNKTAAGSSKSTGEPEYLVVFPTKISTSQSKSMPYTICAITDTHGPTGSDHGPRPTRGAYPTPQSSGNHERRSPRPAPSTSPRGRSRRGQPPMSPWIRSHRQGRSPSPRDRRRDYR